jgi:HAE1 family hydrophobic/amphiphilic exporter-1
MLAVGMLVDNAVVVLESIDRTHRTEEDREKAALIGARSVATAVVAATMTTLIVFLPLVVGADSDLMTWLREIGIAITIALACSLFSSLTLIPLMSAHFLGRRKAKEIPTINWLEERYAEVLGWTLRRKGWTALIIAAIIVLGIVPLVPATGLVKTAIFAATINERIYLNYEFSDHTYKSEAEEAVDQVEAVLFPRREEFDIESIYSFYTENRAGTTMVLARKDLDDDEIRDLRKEIREILPEIAGVRLYFHDDSRQGGDSTFFAVKFFGQDTGVLETYATEAARRIETLEGVQDVRTSFRDSQREVEVRIDREKALRAGLSAQDMADIFSFTLGSMRLPRFNAGEREVDTWLALRLEDRENVDDLKKIQIGGTGEGGQPILLGDIADFRIVPRAREISRENRKVVVAVRATYEGENWKETQKEIGQLMDAFDLPPGYSWSWNQRLVEQQDQNQQMLVNLLLAIVLVYLVMASLFESLAQPFAILVFSIFFALPGAAWLLAATDTVFNLMAQIGLLILMGIVVNNGIILLDHVNQLRLKGVPRDEAIVLAGRERLRPILMTAATTIIGLIPLAVRGPATSGIFFYPLARTVMGGLMSSAVLTLVALPLVSVYFEGLAGWLKGLWRRSAARETATAVAQSTSASLDRA